MITRKDVARLAGVSTTTVSYYINKSGYVSESTQKKISDAIKELDYRPNLIARSLKVKDTKQFVFLCNEIRNPFHAEIAFQVADLARRKGYLTLFCNAIDDNEYIMKICSYQVSGVFIAASKISVDLVNTISRLGIPVVVLDDSNTINYDSNISRIILDFNEVVKQLIDHSIDNGAKDICFISSSKNIDDECRDGKVVAFKEYIKLKENSINSYSIISDITNAEDSYEMMINKYNDSINNIPNCFICCNDAVSSGVVRALYDIGLRVPEDVIVTGFDNSVNSRISIPSITTVDISINKISELAIDMLIKKQRKEKVTDIKLKSKIIERESTKKMEYLKL